MGLLGNKRLICFRVVEELSEQTQRKHTQQCLAHKEGLQQCYWLLLRRGCPLSGDTCRADSADSFHTSQDPIFITDES